MSISFDVGIEYFRKAEGPLFITLFFAWQPET